MFFRGCGHAVDFSHQWPEGAARPEQGAQVVLFDGFFAVPVGLELAEGAGVDPVVVDADVLAHAVMDAVLGAAALGDIGQHFPDTAEEYAGADSLMLARRVAEIMTEHGWRIENIDATILCQRPKLAPHIPAMRAKLAEAFGMPVDAVSVKATTEEHLGFTGEGLGIAAHAVALIEAV